MVSQLPNPIEIDYPDSDSKPMSDNPKQFRWTTTIKYNLDWLFTNDRNIFIAGDLLWYPVEGNPKRRVAPDVMVVFGRPKGNRGSYKQWLEDEIPPNVVFEILSPDNTANKMAHKLAFYECHQVEEYYIYDPDNNALSGWKREDNYLTEIIAIQDWCSPKLGIRFDLNTAPELQIYHPNGLPFSTFEHVSQTLSITELALAVEVDRNQKLMAKLRKLGIDPETIDS
jgi:Uma2 family endonuclease